MLETAYRLLQNLILTFYRFVYCFWHRVVKEVSKVLHHVASSLYDQKEDQEEVEIESGEKHLILLSQCCFFLTWNHLFFSVVPLITIHSLSTHEGIIYSWMRRFLREGNIEGVDY